MTALPLDERLRSRYVSISAELMAISELDKDDLGLLHDLVGLWDLAGRGYTPVEWGAWETLLDAKLVERITCVDGSAPSLMPTVSGFSRVRARRRGRPPTSTEA